MAVDHDPAFVEMAPSGLFSEELCSRAVDEFGSDGAWLVLSIISYGWRSYYDLADALVTAKSPVADAARPLPVVEDFQIVRDLQVQSFIYAAAEQFAGLVRAARAHRSGASAFFDTYMQHKNVGDLVQAITDLEFEELTALIGLPASAADLSQTSTVECLGGPVMLGDPDIDVADVGGILVPKSAISAMAKLAMLERSHELANLILVNISELKLLVDAPHSVDGMPKAQPLREVDNAFRHGHRVLFHDAVPEQRFFRGLGETVENQSHAVDLYMPRGNNSIHFATVFASHDRTNEHLEVLRQLSLRTGQFARGFIGWKTLGTRSLFAAAVELRLGGSE